MLQLKMEIAETILRMFTGVIFLFQGYDKLFNVKIKGVVNTFLTEAEQHHVQRPWVTVVAGSTSFIEFAGGITLILGLFTNGTLLLLGVDLVLAALAFSVVEPVWDMRHVFPRLALVTTLLLMPDQWNLFSMDHLITK